MDLSAVANFIEEEHILEFAGEYFCIRENCEECTEFEEANLEVSEKLPIRLLIGVDRKQLNSYSQTGKMSELNNTVFETEDGVLPESEFCFMKEVEKPFNEHCLYNLSDDKHYCVRQGCIGCENYDECEPIVTKVKKDYITVALDLKAQEPRANTFVAKEPAWLTIFQNDTLRDVTYLLDFLNIAFREMGGNTNSHKYRKFLDNKFFLDRTKLYKFNIAVFKMKKDPSQENQDEVRKYLEEFRLQDLL